MRTVVCPERARRTSATFAGRRGRAGASLLGAAGLSLLAAVAAAGLARVAPSALSAQEPEARSGGAATLTGQVVSAMTGGPLADARVVHLPSGLGTFTDSAGRFVVRNIPPSGSDSVQVGLLGFAEDRMRVDLRPGHVTRAVFSLSRSVLRMEDIRVTVEGGEELAASPKLREFYQRKEFGFGYYFTPEEIEELRPQIPSELLRRVPGVTVGSERLGRSQVRVTGGNLGGGLDCAPRIYIDGLHYPDLRFDDLDAQNLLALEIYTSAAQIPPRFKRGASHCGVIVAWTRDGTRAPTP